MQITKSCVVALVLVASAGGWCWWLLVEQLGARRVALTARAGGPPPIWLGQDIWLDIWQIFSRGHQHQKMAVKLSISKKNHDFCKKEAKKEAIL